MTPEERIIEQLERQLDKYDDKVNDLEDTVRELRDEVRVLSENQDKLRDLVEYAYREASADCGEGFDSVDTDFGWRDSNSKLELGRIR